MANSNGWLVCVGLAEERRETDRILIHVILSLLFYYVGTGTYKI